MGPGGRGQTRLSDATSYGNDRTVNMLLGREGADSENIDNCSNTPLWLAAFDRCDGAVKPLLGQEAVSPNRPDNRLSCPELDGGIRECYATTASQCGNLWRGVEPRRHCLVKITAILSLAEHVAHRSCP